MELPKRHVPTQERQRFRGTKLDDVIIGLNGYTSRLQGGRGSDLLRPIGDRITNIAESLIFDPNLANPNARVQMRGGRDADIFMLGDQYGDYFTLNQSSDHGLIQDLELRDRIVLAHRASDYTVTPRRIRRGKPVLNSGIEIRTLSGNDLIAIVRGKALRSLWQSNLSGESLLRDPNGPFQFLELNPISAPDPLV